MKKCMLLLEIQLLRPDEFVSIIAMLGAWHAEKTMLKCLGIYLKGSEAESLWLEANVYGPNVIENSLINAGDYNRDLHGMSLLAECVDRLILKEFFQGGEGHYVEQLKLHQQLRVNTEKNQTYTCQDIIKTLASSILLSDYNKFINERKESHENFLYWFNFKLIFQVVHDSIRADREGDFNLHLDAFRRALVLFAAFDRPNYLRWGSVYFEDMLKLHTTAPDVYENFMAGKFSIKERPERFISVAGDQKPEQSINLSSKKSQSVIGNAKQKQFIAQWNLFYHEMADIHRLDKEYTGCIAGEGEVFIHHLSSSKITRCHENSVREMMDVFEKYGNPLSNDTPYTLHNFVTKQAMSDGIRHDLLHYIEIGERRYITFRKERIVDKTTELYKTIHRANLRNMASLHPKFDKSVKTAVKEAVHKRNLSERAIEIARSRGATTEEFLNHDMAPSPLLYNLDGTMTKPEKHVLLTELELLTGLNDSQCNMGHAEAQIVDVMGVVRKIKTTGFNNFGDLAREFYKLTEYYDVTLRI